MAHLRKGILSTPVGSIGQIVGFHNSGKGVIRSKTMSKNFGNSPVQALNITKMRQIAKMYKASLTVVGALGSFIGEWPALDWNYIFKNAMLYSEFDNVNTLDIMLLKGGTMDDGIKFLGLVFEPLKPTGVYVTNLNQARSKYSDLSVTFRTRNNSNNTQFSSGLSVTGDSLFFGGFDYGYPSGTVQVSELFIRSSSAGLYSAKCYSVFIYP